MIEIRISNTAAVQLLVERIDKEFSVRKEYGLYKKDLIFEDLPFSEIFEITEIAAYDLATLLPYDIFVKETNISAILSRAVQSLATIYHREEFAFYTEQMAEKLMSNYCKELAVAEEKKAYIKN